MIRVASPLFLLLLLLAPLLIRSYLHGRKGRTGSLRFSDLSVIGGLPPSPSLRYRHLLIVFRVAAVILVVLALARPQSGLKGEEVLSEGIDIILTLDISGSMRAEDFKPHNRIYAAKRVLTAFVRGRKSDRIGLVAFGGQSFTQCPLTLDYNVLLRLLEQVDTGMVEDGTAIGMGIANSVNRLRQSKAKSKVIILLTDGVNNTGAIDPITAARTARALGIKIYAVGVGKKGGAPIPIDDPVFGRTYARNPDGSLVLTRIDEATLKKIASITNGDYFRATDARTLMGIYRKIDRLERTKIKTRAYTRYNELFPYFLWPAVVLLLAETALAHTRFRKLP